MAVVDLSNRHGGPAGGVARTRIATDDPAKFVTAFTEAVAGDGEIFLFNPGWGEVERRQADALLAANPAARGERGRLMIPTGGTSGGVRFARHDSLTLGAAINGFMRHFALDRVNALGLLPLYHVSGLMAWMRCAASGGSYLPADWKEIEAGRRPDLPAQPDGWVVSLVPTQLARLLREPAAVEWLQRFRIIFLGGAPAWPDLLERAAAARLTLSLGYGLTETAAMVAALTPAEFLAGGRSCGRALPHARLVADESGTIGVGGESVFRGYFPGWRDDGILLTGDLGEFDREGRLTVFGRRDDVIITGGEKVNPAEVEAVLRASGEFTEVAVLGSPHPEWGQQVVAVYPAGRRMDLGSVNAFIGTRLAAAKRPKLYVPLTDWPADSPGKLRRAGLARLLGAQLRSGANEQGA